MMDYNSKKISSNFEDISIIDDAASTHILNQGNKSINSYQFSVPISRDKRKERLQSAKTFGSYYKEMPKFFEQGANSI